MRNKTIQKHQETQVTRTAERKHCCIHACLTMHIMLCIKCLQHSFQPDRNFIYSYVAMYVGELVMLRMIEFVNIAYIAELNDFPFERCYPHR